MQDHKHKYDYAIVRVIPKVERDEFINAGVILFSSAAEYLQAKIELDEQRLKVLDPDADIPTIKSHLNTIPMICRGGDGAGPIGKLTQRERFHWLVAPRSTIIQASPVHSGYCMNPEAALEHLLNTMVRQGIGKPSGSS